MTSFSFVNDRGPEKKRYNIQPEHDQKHSDITHKNKEILYKKGSLQAFLIDLIKQGFYIDPKRFPQLGQ